MSHENMNDLYWTENGPFELSPERGRFALIYSVMNDRSFSFSLPVARFAAPDVGYYQGNYVSLFAPGISFLALPGYMLGNLLGSAQVGSFAVISLFAILNLFLVRAISMKLGGDNNTSTIAGLLFLFGSPAFTYGVSLYQHHVSTALLLTGFYLLCSSKKLLLPLIGIWFVCAASIPIDYPNAFFLAPIGIAALGRIIWKEESIQKTSVHFKPQALLTFVGMVIPIALFMRFNYLSYGNPLQLAGTVQQVKQIDADGNPVNNATSERNDDSQNATTVAFFDPRSLVHGLYTLTISADRGIVTFAPVLLLGLLGIPILYKKNPQVTALMLSIIGINFLLYGMWGDPYGGWAFGSRYLLPTYAMLSIFLAQLLSHSKSKVVFLLLLLLAIYSLSVNSLGAITSSRNPPKTEAIPLGDVTGRIEKYSFDRNWEYLTYQGSKSFIYNTIGKHYLSPQQYYAVVLGYVLIGFLYLYKNLIVKNYSFRVPKLDKQVLGRAFVHSKKFKMNTVYGYVQKFLNMGKKP
ncbi:MAG: hypothetical protein WAU07_03035 [Microgenomates group bacterium]